MLSNKKNYFGKKTLRFECNISKIDLKWKVLLIVYDDLTWLLMQCCGGRKPIKGDIPRKLFKTKANCEFTYICKTYGNVYLKGFKRKMNILQMVMIVCSITDTYKHRMEMCKHHKKCRHCFKLSISILATDYCNLQK